MKRQYISPAVNVHELKVESDILQVSNPITIKSGAAQGHGSESYCEEEVSYRGFDDGQTKIEAWEGGISTF